jgi:menaquinone-dependent protoporphyrinogen oxidase
MRVLVTYGSERGGTAGIAATVVAELGDHGIETVLAAAPDVTSVAGFDAVVVGGALYAGRWHKDARRLVERHAAALKGVPVWLFSSGPIGDMATKEPDAPPVPGVRTLIDLAGARGHVTFAGRLEEHPRGFVARMIARKWAGDWRDDAAIRRWAADVASELGAARGAA